MSNDKQLRAGIRTVVESLLRHFKPMPFAQRSEVHKSLWDNGWRFKWSWATKTTGVCSYNKKRIYLSVHYIANRDDSRIMNTILHEIAHAMCGPGYGHSSVWVDVAKAIGCTAERCSQDVDQMFRFETLCSDCLTVTKRTAGPRSVQAISSRTCRSCGGNLFQRAIKL